jgi:hypothetical protein
MLISVMPICTVERKARRIGGEVEHLLGAHVALLGHLAQPRRARRHGGDLGQVQQAVEQDQEQEDEETEIHPCVRGRASRAVPPTKTAGTGYPETGPAHQPPHSRASRRAVKGRAPDGSKTGANVMATM